MIPIEKPPSVMGGGFRFQGGSFKFGFIGLTEPSGNGECDPHPPPAAELVGTFPLGEGKGMWKPFFSLKPKEKHSFGDEGKLPFPRACLPLRGRCRQLLRRRRMRVTQKVSSWFKLSDKLQFEGHPDLAPRLIASRTSPRPPCGTPDRRGRPGPRRG